MGIFISVQKTIECVVIAVSLAALICLAVYKQLGVLQSCGYSSKKYAKWLRKKTNLTLGRYVILALLCLFSSAVVSLCFSFLKGWAAVVSLIVYPVFFITYFFADKKLALRSEVTFTPRLKRLYAAFALVTAVIAYLSVTLLNFASEVWGNAVFAALRYCPLAVLPMLILPCVFIANGIDKLYEIPHNSKFLKSAKKRLASSDIKVIAITGSYGKTSTKFILNSILSQKYKVLCTARSHNTPLGIALAVNTADFEKAEIFIAEMGARHVGDIAELCDICPPDVSLITGVCGQHLETFKTFENIVKAKGEILQATKENAIIADDCYELFADYPCKKERVDCIKDIVSTAEGTQFTLTLGGDSVRAHTKLLGEHSARNIALAAQAAYAAGMSVEEIATAISALEFIEHRLQLIKSNGVNILDDGYNSNVKGASAAVETLKLFTGKKIAVTPGLVELGVLEEEENFALGKKLVGLDWVILVGEMQVTPVKEGYLAGGGDKEKLFVVPTLAAAQEKLKELIETGDTVLFLNDLPDVY